MKLVPEFTILRYRGEYLIIQVNTWSEEINEENALIVRDNYETYRHALEALNMFKQEREEQR